MAFIAIPDTVQAELRFLLVGEPVEVTLYFRNLVEVSTGTMEALAADLNTWAVDALMDSLGAECVYQGCKLTDLTTSTSPVVEDTLGSPVAGGNVGSPLSNQDTFCIQFKTGLRGRSFRGRNYIPGLSVTMTTDPNHVADSWANLIVTAYELLMDAETLPVGWEWVVASRYADGAPRSPGIATPVTSVGYADLRLDKQERRLPAS